MAKLYFRHGAMNSGKSTALLQVAHNYEERGQAVILAKPNTDSKGEDAIVSRLGVERSVDGVDRRAGEIEGRIRGEQSGSEQRP
jgi:thymidine kinase